MSIWLKCDAKSTTTAMLTMMIIEEQTSLAPAYRASIFSGGRNGIQCLYRGQDAGTRQADGTDCHSLLYL